MFCRALYCTVHTCIIIISACAESLYPPKVYVTIHILKLRRQEILYGTFCFGFFFISTFAGMWCGNLPYRHFFNVLVLSTIVDLFLLNYMYGYNFCNSKYTMVTYRIPTIIIMSLGCASGQVGSRVYMYIPGLETFLRLEFESSYIVHV